MIMKKDPGDHKSNAWAYQWDTKRLKSECPTQQGYNV